MSIRPGHLEEAKRFSLNDYMGATVLQKQQQQQFPVHSATTNATNARVAQYQQPDTRGAPPPAAPARLSFSFNTQHLQQHQAPQAAAPPVSANANMPSLTFNLPKISREAATAAPIPGANSHLLVNHTHAPQQQRTAASEDVMRLTAQLLETREKINRMQSKLQATEQSVARANQTLVSERISAMAQRTQLTTELRVSRDAEAKLKTELANSPKRVEYERSMEAFKIQTEGAIRLEEEHTSLKQHAAELDTKMKETQESLHELTLQHDSLLAEHEAKCKALGVAQSAAATTDTCCNNTKPDTDATDTKAPPEVDTEAAAVTAARAEAQEAIDELTQKLTEANSASKLSEETAAALMQERDKMASSKTYVEELLSQSADSKKALELKLEETTRLLDSTQAILTTELPHEAVASLKRYTDASVEAHRLANAQPAVHTAGSKSNLVHAQQRADRLFQTLATGTLAPAVSVSSDRNTLDLHSTRQRSKSKANRRFKTYVKSQSSVPMTAATSAFNQHATAINQAMLHTKSTIAQTARGQVVVVIDNDINTPDFADADQRVSAAVTAISADMKKVFKALQISYQHITTPENEATEACGGRSHYDSSSSSSSESDDDDNDADDAADDAADE